MTETHHLKTWPQVFGRTWDGLKLYEIRKADRLAPYALGDRVVLREWLPDTRKYTGRAIVAEITAVSRDAWGLPSDLLVFGVRIARRVQDANLELLPVQSYEVTRA